MVVRRRSLAEVTAWLEQYFLKASVTGDAVSNHLEASNDGFKRGPHSILGALCCLSAPSVEHDRVDIINSEQRHSSTLR
uniref:Uncharacterized protein n=1 Tax=Oryza nivara TaxID=4536 RepID=A0A0E0J3E1_ORYNI